MRNSSENSKQSLLIDDVSGVVLQAPPEPTVSRRYLETSPGVTIQNNQVTLQEGDYLYVVQDEYAGFLRLRRVA